MRLRIIDAFTDRPFAGNPAGVCLLEEPAPQAWMSSVAAELNLSETAFAVPTGPGRWDLRWFTPTTEVDLCGHATLATAHALHSDGVAGPYSFVTRSGELRAQVAADGTVRLDFPAQPTSPLSPELTGPLVEHLEAALGVHPEEVESNGIDVVVRISDEGHVRALSADTAALAAVDARCVIVTAAVERRPLAEDVVLGGDAPDAGGVPDAVSRVFCPRVGVPEDPVTGSAHCALGPFWAQRLGRTELEFHQVSRRGGRLAVRVLGERVELAGRAVTVLDGELAAGPR
ncbi:PhzF family phenazine biosynthesis protein [Kineococcus xinjiangensis]|uniref:PhzF family phenazine biosynthesis protein n=1 Tax=Kineococcus xinjiangensis TaxID=512762 RepID=A0A2S6ILZ4_9ACTN|nr:PhzF family phenazine biosynthesis protein [Kineococcus xinjiangensis]PPK95208.1 PhzF family phenazine biosynthesis protein [Kineococcus xinjiangensis]